MHGFTKLFSTLITSTVWREGDKVRVVWITMLALADKNGVVPASVPGLAAMANVSTEECRAALGVLLAPDVDSRTREHEGRRIEEVDGGWRLLNYAKYREMGRSVDRSEYLRVKQQEHRDKKRQPVSTTVNQSKPISEAEAEAEANTESDQVPISSSRLISSTAETPKPASSTEPALLTFRCDGEPRSWDVTKPQVKRWRELFPSLDIGKECRAALAWVEADPTRRKTSKGMPRFLVGWFNKAQNSGRGGTSASKPVTSFAVQAEDSRRERANEARLAELRERINPSPKPTFDRKAFIAEMQAEQQKVGAK